MKDKEQFRAELLARIEKLKDAVIAAQEWDNLHWLSEIVDEGELNDYCDSQGI